MKFRNAFKVLLLTVVALLLLWAFSIRERYGLVHSLVRTNGISQPEWCRDNEWLPEWAVALIICVRQGPIECVAVRGKPGIDDRWAKCIATVRGIQKLYVSGTQITEAGVPKLLEIESLEHLDLDDLPITGDCFTQLSFKHNNLIWISLSGTNISDESLTHLDLFPELIVIDADRTRIGNNGIENLARCKNLRWLHLNGTSIDDACGPALTRIRHLEELYLMNTNVSDDLLNHLANCPSLKRVLCDGSRISEAGVKRFRELRPSVVIGIARKNPDPSPIPQEGNALADREPSDSHSALDECVE
jgi:hypothetical protein